MAFFIDPATTASVTWLIHSDDIRRAEQSRVARELRAGRRARSNPGAPKGINRLAALFGRRQPLH